MFNFSIENESGDRLDFTNEAVYQITDIQGLDSPEANINTNKTTQYSGTSYLSYSINDREITFSVKVNGDIEQNRLNLYNYIRAGAKLRLHFTNYTRAVYIDGHVSHIDYNLFSSQQIIQVTVLCPYPYFSNYDETILSLQSSFPLFKFPFSIAASGIPFSTYSSTGTLTNTGEREVGAVFMIEYNGQSDFTNVLSISNSTTGKLMQFSGLTLNTNNLLMIDTRKTKLLVRLCNRTGMEFENVISKMTGISDFLTFPVGSNSLRIGYSTAANDRQIYNNPNLSMTVSLTAEWEAV